jgi:telomere length regulation protein
MDASTALRHCRDTLRTPIPDVETFTSLLDSTMIALHPETTSPDHLKAINRFLPGIQTSLLTLVIPTFLAALDEPQQLQLSTYFCPSSGPPAVRRAVASTSYLTLPFLLSPTPPAVPLPPQSRSYILATLEALGTYGIDQVYWAVWASGTSEGVRTLQWEETVRALVGVPAKVANAVGRWKTERWAGDIPEGLVPRWVKCEYR